MITTKTDLETIKPGYSERLRDWLKDRKEAMKSLRLFWLMKPLY
jgi:hypothetical protein